MNVYRMEVTIIQDMIQKVINVVIAAQDDQSAFRLAEIEVEKTYLKLPEVEEMAILEKKKIGKGGGFVL